MLPVYIIGPHVIKLCRSALHVLGGQRDDELLVDLVDADIPIRAREVHETTDVFIEGF